MPATKAAPLLLEVAPGAPYRRTRVHKLPASPLRTSRARLRGLLAHQTLAGVLVLGAVLAPVPAAHGEGLADHPEEKGNHRGLDVDELELQGARIGSIRYRIIDVFDTSSPGENRKFYRAVDSLHIKTREDTIRRQVLFKEGDPFRQSILEETERNLRALPFIRDAQVVAESVQGGAVGVLVTTQDTWTTRVGARFGSSGRQSTTSFAVNELNLLGRGKGLEFSVRNGIERTTQTLKYQDRNLFGSRFTLDANYQNSTDGSGGAFQFERPFFSLGTRQAYGMTALKGSRQFSLQQDGDTIQRFDHDITDASAWYGWSGGLQGATVTRWKAGYEYRKDLFDPQGILDPGYPSENIPASLTHSGPTIEYSRLGSNFVRVKYYERFSRNEDFNLGSAIDLRLHFSNKSFGGTNNEVLYTFSASRGFRVGQTGHLFTSGSLQGRAGKRDTCWLHAEAAHYYTGWPRQTILAKLSGDLGIRLDATDRLFLGGDSGLRGFDAQRFDGDRRVLLNLEDRIHSNRQFFHLFQLGGAVFVDVGNAWGNVRMQTVCALDATNKKSCVLSTGETDFGNLKANVGIALLIDVVRSSHAAFVRVNFAYPLNGGRYEQGTVLVSFGN